MTPERLEEARGQFAAIKERAKGPEWRTPAMAQERREDDFRVLLRVGADLLAYVDELRAQVRAGQKSIARESHRQAALGHTAAHLLAHQQARGVRLRRLGAIAAVGAADQVAALRAKLEQAEMDVRDGVRLIRDLTAERDTLRAENDRYRKALERIADPIQHCINEARARGEQLDGGMAIHISEDAAWHQQQARAALTPEAK